MAEEFTPITTQEQFDLAIGERIKRERETLSKKYGDYEAIKGKVSEYETKIGELNTSIRATAEKYSGYDKQLEELQGKVKGYEANSVKMRIARDAGIPYELAERLTGENEAAIKKDADMLAKLLGKSTTPAPLKDSEPAGDNKKEAAYRALTAQLINKGE
ncbi:MAG: DUF4355 domain-containing protein [Oscillospiraceae bacterium]